ncbi:MAG: RNB domain-containing ribonuclease [Geodermatophilaceae bacterium]|nr:RNB domain-containing ribonuclease [Geodermatophilaceae bacterium]
MAVPSFDVIRADLKVRQAFPPEVLREAEACVANRARDDRNSLDLPFVTIDPAQSMDLDQALHVERTASGYRVHYAIADVAAFVGPGGPMDTEAWVRGVTLYSPDMRAPLYPRALSEGVASLLPDKDRPALVWSFALDDAGEASTVELHRRVVRSVAKLDYAGVQTSFAKGSAHPSIAALAELGPILVSQARDRGAIELPAPDQEVVSSPDGSWTLAMRSQLPVERWNAQISLLTGRAAAQLMLAKGVGVLRTLPPPEVRTVAQLREIAASLGIGWAPGDSPAQILSTMHGDLPREVAFIEQAAALLRGSGYTAFDTAGGSKSLPEHILHAGVGAPYAHVTAPLRRLADRYANEVCLAIQQGREIEEWAHSRLADLPDAMANGQRHDSELERACLDATEAAVLSDRIGEELDGIVVDAEDQSATVIIRELAVRAKCPAQHLALGATVRLLVVAVDLRSRTVQLAVAE